MNDEDAVRQALGCELSKHRDAIEQRWLEAVRGDVAVTHMSPTDLVDGLPDYLKALADSLANGDGESVEDLGRAAWADVARHHGVTRAQQGLDVSQLVREFTLLRRSIVAELQASPHEITIIADLISVAVVLSVQEYMRARDMELRRKQVESAEFLTHQLRNPLTSATLAASVMKAHGEEDLLDAIRRNHVRMDHLIDRALLRYKLQLGEFVMHRAPTRLGSIVSEAVEVSAREARAKGLPFEVSVDDAAVVWVDPVWMRAALENLIEDVVRFSDDGRVRVSSNEEKERLVLHVVGQMDRVRDRVEAMFESDKAGQSPGAPFGFGEARAVVLANGGVFDIQRVGMSYDVSAALPEVA